MSTKLFTDALRAIRVYNGKIIPYFKRKGKPSALSPSALNELVAGVNALTNPEIRRGPTDSVFIADKKVVYQIGDQTSTLPPLMHPFKVYKSINQAGNVAIKFPWQCWSVRGGMITNRTRGGQGFDGNAESLFRTIGDGSDGVVRIILNGVSDFYTYDTEPNPTRQDGGSLVSIIVEDVVVGNTGDFTVSDPANAARFIIDSTVDGLGVVAAGFWLEGVDNGTSGVFDSWRIKCRMFSEAVINLGRAADPWPDPATNIIPIAQIGPPNGNLGGSPPNPPPDLIVQYQMLDRHLNYRYPPGPGWSATANLPYGGAQSSMFFRGIWDGPDTDGLSGQFYYDGDVVAVPVAGQVLAVVGGGGGTVTLPDSYALYVKAGNGFTSVQPPGGSWVPIGAFA